MSAAATAAGYLYASGRLRGRGDRGHEQEHHHSEHAVHAEQQPPAQKPRRQVKVAVYQPEPQPAASERPKKTPKIEYRTRRWKPE